MTFELRLLQKDSSESKLCQIRILYYRMRSLRLSPIPFQPTRKTMIELEHFPARLLRFPKARPGSSSFHHERAGRGSVPLPIFECRLYPPKLIERASGTIRFLNFENSDRTSLIFYKHLTRTRLVAHGPREPKRAFRIQSFLG